MKTYGLLVAGFVVLLLGIADMNSHLTAGAGSVLPLRMVEVTIESEMRDEFVRKVREFADANGFAIRVSQSSPDPDDVLIQLWREDVRMISVNNTDTGAPDLKYAIGIYQNSDRLLPDTALNQLVQGIRSEFIKMQGLVHFEVK